MFKVRSSNKQTIVFMMKMTIHNLIGRNENLKEKNKNESIIVHTKGQTSS